MTNTNSFGTKIEDAESTHAEAPHTSEADLPEADELGEGLRAGDRDALQALLQATRPRLAAVALRIVRNPDDAEDVVQDAFLKAWRYVGRFEGRAALSTWLHRIVVNTAVDHIRSRRTGVVLFRTAEGSDDDHRPLPEGVSAPTPEDLLARAEIGAVVRRGISRLSVVHQEVLTLRELQDESYQEIADTVHCPIGTVMSRLHHARQRLAETLADEGRNLVRRAA